MGERFRRANHLSISSSHPGQISLLPPTGGKISTSQSAATLYAAGEQVWFIPLVDKRVGGW